MISRGGKRRNRNESFPSRHQKLGNYLIVTDAKETEINYLNGLKNSLPDKYKDNISIKVLTDVPPRKMIDTLREESSINPQYSERWIVMDRDKVPDFDEIMKNAESKGIHLGWSNPCIEIWFLAYYGSMPILNDSVQCVRDFKKEFQRYTGLEYEKAIKNIYQKLYESGDEDKAIVLAKTRYKNSSDNYNKPSEMLSTTLLYELVSEIRHKCPK